MKIAKLSFNFNDNLVESRDGYILNFPSHPPTTHPEKYGMTSGMKHITPTLTPSFLYNINYNF